MKKVSDLRSRPICSILHRLHRLDIWSWSRRKWESISRSCYPIRFPISVADDETLPYTCTHLLIGLASSSVIHVMHASLNGKWTWFIFFLIVSKSMWNSRSPCVRIIIINLIFPCLHIEAHVGLWRAHSSLCWRCANGKIGSYVGEIGYPIVN